MEFKIDLPDEFKNVNPKNIIVPYEWLLYKVDYNYSTMRRNKKSNSKYILVVNKIYLDSKSKNPYDIVANMILKNSDAYKNLLKVKLVQEPFLEWINKFNLKYPFRSLFNVEIINISEESDFNFNIKNNKLVLNINSNNDNEKIELIKLYDNIDVKEASIEYTTRNGKRKKTKKYFIIQKVSDKFKDYFLYDDVLKLFENEDFSSIVNLYFGMFSLKNKHIRNNKNQPSNVKILDVFDIGSFNY